MSTFFPEEAEILKRFLVGDRISNASPHAQWVRRTLLDVTRTRSSIFLMLITVLPQEGHFISSIPHLPRFITFLAKAMLRRPDFFANLLISSKGLSS
jgi:hypothetical protein